MKCLFKYPTEVRFVLEILENSKVIASEHINVLHPLKNPPGQNRRPLNYVAFLLVTLVDSTPFLIYSRNSTCYNFHPQSIPCLQTYSLGFFLKQCDLKGCLSIDEQWMRTVCGSKTFNKFQTFERSQHFSTYLREKDSFLKNF